MKKLHIKTQREKEFYKIVIARSDITNAMRLCDLFLRVVSDIQNPFYFALQDAIVTSYARPFSRNKPFGSLTDKWKEFGDLQQSDLHNRLVGMRNQSVAHSDMSVRRVYIRPPGTAIEALNDKNEAFGVEIENQYLEINDIRLIQLLCRELGSRLNVEVDKELEEIYGQMSLPPEAIQLIYKEKKS